MLCPNCGVDTPAPGGRCGACHAAIQPPSSNAVTTTTVGSPLNSQAETSLGIPASAPSAGTLHGRLEAGAPFGARYRILRALGSGGMGVVYQAWDDELGVAVALKVIRPEVTADPHVAREVERRFKRELLLARQVTHKNVVRIHDLGEVDGIKYITMPYVEGRDLAGVLRESGTLPVPRALRMAKQVAAGLHAAHEAGVIHRDLKPENIMITADDQALIMDFGISRTTRNTSSTMTQHGAIVGTLEYMAPEQGRGAAIDHRADIYAFGLMLHDMLAGRRRLDATDGAVAEMMSRMQKAPPPLRTLVPSIPEPLERIVQRCVQPDPAQRYATTAELVADLERLDSQGHLLPDRVSSRRLTPIVAGLVALVVILAATAAWFWRARTDPGGSRAVPKREPVSVLVANFRNDTGDTIFEGALEQALGIGIEGASFVTSFPRRDAERIAQQLNRASLDETTARLVSQREGVKVVLAGAIAASGSGYRVRVRAVDPVDGTVIRSAEASASNKGEVLEAVGRIAADVRRALGDSELASASAFGSETFTTASLEAMHAYARGQQLSLAGKTDEALSAYAQAVRLDAGFGRAYAGMGVIYGNLKRIDHAEANYKLALQHLERMTERERYRTLGAYYLLVARNYEKAVESYETLVSRYPADNAGHANLAIAYLQLRNVRKALEEGRKAIEIYPHNVSQRANYAMYAMYAGDFTMAIEEAKRALAQNPSYDFALLTLARAYLAAGDTASASAAYDRLERSGPVGVSWASLGRADLQMYQGRFGEAVRILTPGIPADAAAKNSYEAAVKLVALGEAQLALGRQAEAATSALEAAARSQQEGVLFPAGRILIQTGRDADVARVAAALEGLLQTHTTSYAQLLQGELLLARGSVAQAIDRMRDAERRHNSWFARFLLGRAYVAAGHHAEALAEFDACMKRIGEAADAFIADSPTLRYIPPVHYWLGRAHEGIGASASARASYEAFLKLRSGPDVSDPLAIDARARLALAGSR